MVDNLMYEAACERIAELEDEKADLEFAMAELDKAYDAASAALDILWDALSEADVTAAALALSESEFLRGCYRLSGGRYSDGPYHECLKG